jgi:adhesin/invasin
MLPHISKLGSPPAWVRARNEPRVVIDKYMMRLNLSSRLILPFSLLAMLACGGEDLTLPTGSSPSSPAPSQLHMAAGDKQTGIAGSALPEPVMVQVLDDSGNGLPGQQVSWVVGTGGGSATPQASTTDQQGFASATWTLGSPGSNTLAAVVSGVGSVTFSAMANAGDDNGGGGNGGGNNGGGNNGGGSGGGSGTVPSASASTVSADPSSIQVGSGVSNIRVTVRDQSGAPVSGAVVTLTASGTGNTLVQPGQPTGADGVAVGSLRSSVAGTKDVTATVNGTMQIGETAQIFVALAPATRVVMLEGNNQRAGTGQTLAVSPAVRVTDAAGDPVAGFGVTFVVTAGGGTVSGASQTTDANGVARVGSWTLGSSAGQNTLEARAGSLTGSPVVFNATATAPQPPPPTAAPDHFVFTVQPHDVNEKQFFTVQVAIMDASGNVVPLDGTEIYIGLLEIGEDHPLNGHLMGDRFEDTQGGMSTFNLAVDRKGTYHLLARSDYLPKNLGPYGPELFSNTFQVR